MTVLNGRFSVEVIETRGDSSKVRYWHPSGEYISHWVRNHELTPQPQGLGLDPRKVEQELLSEGKCPRCLLERHTGECP